MWRHKTWNSLTRIANRSQTKTETERQREGRSWYACVASHTGQALGFCRLLTRTKQVNYYKFADDYIPPTCSGRMPCYAKLLNDEYVSIADGRDAFCHMRRTQYEIAMFLCEDDRYELDMLIESTLSTIRFFYKQLEVLAKAENKASKADEACKDDKAERKREKEREKERMREREKEREGDGEGNGTPVSHVKREQESGAGGEKEAGGSEKYFDESVDKGGERSREGVGEGPEGGVLEREREKKRESPSCKEGKDGKEGKDVERKGSSMTSPRVVASNLAKEAREKESKHKAKVLAEVVKGILQPRHTKVLQMLYLENWPDIAECFRRSPKTIKDTLAVVLRRLEIKVGQCTL